MRAQAQQHTAADDPVISVDTKKKELVGAYENGGREWSPARRPEPVKVHDFIDPTPGKANPYGVYDVAADTGLAVTCHPALARGAHMSAGHLSRQFRLAYGESPYAYLITRRIERATALLRRGDLSVTEVCFAVAARRWAPSALTSSGAGARPPASAGSTCRSSTSATSTTSSSSPRRSCRRPDQPGTGYRADLRV